MNVPKPPTPKTIFQAIAGLESLALQLDEFIALSPLPNPDLVLPVIWTIGESVEAVFRLCKRGWRIKSRQHDRLLRAVRKIRASYDLLRTMGPQ